MNSREQSVTAPEKEEPVLRGKWLLYSLIGLQLIAWAWHQYYGGQLSAHDYYKFCGMMMCGQFAAGIECYVKKTWGTFVVQAYFFVWTGIGWFQRYQEAAEQARQALGL